MSNVTYRIFHKSHDGKFLVEVKRYKLLAYVGKWFFAHQGARVYVWVKRGSLTPVWWRYSEATFRKNAKLVRVTGKLPEVLDGLPVEPGLEW